MFKADLHIHTNYSDGYYSPIQILNQAKRNGLSAISITDHDTVSGIDEALQYGKTIGIDVIPGIELNINVLGKEVHILGYFIDCKNENLNNYITQIKLERQNRAEKIIEKLNNFGISILLSDVEEIANGSPICRPHIAKVLVKKKIVKTYAQAFIQYLGDFAKANSDKVILDPNEVLQVIKNAGGKVVIAHPADIDIEIIKWTIELGIDGIEIFHPSHKQKHIELYKDLCKKNNLFETGGSDFHGGEKRDNKNFGKYYIDKTSFDKFYNS